MKNINETNTVKLGHGGIGYKSVPHPFNFDYTCSLEEVEVAEFVSTTS